MQEMTKIVAQAIADLFDVDIVPEFTRPAEQFGDYATNVALQLAGRLSQPPRDIAQQIVDHLSQQLDSIVAKVAIAGSGFINLTLHDDYLLQLAGQATAAKPTTYASQTVVVEYSDPNPFKVLHVGHLYTTLVGDVVARIIEMAGATVHRVNFGGDVGLHVAKNMWAILQAVANDPKGLEKIDADPHKRAAWLSQQYIKGNTAYEEDETAKAEIIELNKKVYQLHKEQDYQSAFAQIYWTCRQWSYEYFAVLYRELDVVPFEKYYPESQTTPVGVQTVEEQLAKGVYQKSDGAVVFDGEKYGLHTRVFINSHGLPTYETKDVGLIMQKWQDYHFDLSVIITASDIVEYMKVVQKSIEQFAPQLTARSRHLTHGNIKLRGGVKMSSRKGNGLLALDVLEVARAASSDLRNDNQSQTSRDDQPDHDQNPEAVSTNEATVLAAIKYAFLKQRIGADIIYDPQESVSLEGNSGPYLQYAHARARSILAKNADAAVSAAQTAILPDTLEAGERSLVRKLTEYPEVLAKTAIELLPHYICTYLYELAQSFNHFYEHNRVIGSPRQAERLSLVALYADVLQDGLQILGIVAPERV